MAPAAVSKIQKMAGPMPLAFAAGLSEWPVKTTLVPSGSQA